MKAETLTITYHGKKIRLTPRMQRSLEYALKMPDRWHTIGLDQESKDAIRQLEKSGLVEIREYSGHYKINPKF